jgi:hypothetical protein
MFNVPLLRTIVRSRPCFRDDDRPSQAPYQPVGMFVKRLAASTARATGGLASGSISLRQAAQTAGLPPRPLMHASRPRGRRQRLAVTYPARIPFRSCRMIGRAGARRATSLKPARANVEAVPVKMFDVLSGTSVSTG